MTTFNYQDSQHCCKIIRLEIIDGEDKRVDILNAFKTININESIDNVLMTGNLTFDSEYQIRETFPMKGNEQIHIMWQSHEEEKIRDHYFHITAIEEIIRPGKDLVEEYHVNFVTPAYIKLMRRFEDCYVEKTVEEILNSINSELQLDVKQDDVDLIVDIDLDNSSETFNLYNLNPTIISFIKELRYVMTIPYCFYQKSNYLYFRSWDSLFNQTEGIKFNSPNGHPFYFMIDIMKHDINDLYDTFTKGLEGYYYSNVDIFNKTKELIKKELPSDFIKKKILSENVELLKCIETSANQEDNIVSDFLTSRLENGISGLYVGDKIQLVFPGVANKEFSAYSGEYIIYQLTHSIDVNLRYEQKFVLVRKNMFYNFMN